MSSLLIRRALQSVFVLLAMSLIVFAGIYAIGNPAEILINPQANQQETAHAIHQLGLDQPLWQQYFIFLQHLAAGDLGRSFVYGSSALALIAVRLPATLELAVSAMLIALGFGIPLGLWAGAKPKSALSKTIMGGSILGFSLPSFWVGMLLIMLFAVQWGWLPSGGRGATVDLFGIPFSFLTLDGLAHLALPAFNLALFNLSLIIRLTCAETRVALTQDYVRTARAKGLGETRIIGVHVLRNILLPIVTVSGLEFGSLIAFAVVTETIFAWPGIGKLLIDSIGVLDRPVIVAYLLMTVLMFTLINLLTDLLYAVLDPRVRFERRAA